MRDEAVDIPEILNQVALGCVTLFDSARKPTSSRMEVLPLQAECADVDALMKVLQEQWSEKAGTLQLTSRSAGCEMAFLSAAMPDHFVAEVPSQLVSDAAWADVIKAQASAKQQLALGGRPAAETAEVLLKCFKHHVLDFHVDRKLGVPAVVAGQVPAFVQSGVTSVVDAQESFKRGAKAVCGWPLGAEPDGSKSRKGVPTSVNLVIDLIQRVDREEPAGKLETVLRGDPSLAFKLMKFINSPGFGMSVEITSIAHAIMILGYQRLKRWLALLMTSAFADADVKPLVFLSVRRGFFMEELARQCGADERTRGEVFICGVFSMLDRMMGEPFAKLLDALPLPENVSAALIKKTGPYHGYLSLAAAVESGDVTSIVARAGEQKMALGKVNHATLRSMALAKEMTSAS